MGSASDDPTLPSGASPSPLRADAPQVRIARAAVLGALFGADEAPTIGRYCPTRRLGAGASGTVFLARDTKLERDVALKVLTAAPAQGMNSEAEQRYLREGQTIARLSHPNVVEIYDVGVHDGLPFLAMELVDGGSLDEWLTERPRAHDEILAAFIQAAEGLAAAHEAGIVHRDFKPANVLIGKDGRVRVADFGRG